MKNETVTESFALAGGVSAAVIAGAGTGKTTRLIGEIVALIERRGVPIERILAVTFSDGAAADMKHKLRTRLSAPLGDTHGDRFQTALLSLPRAQISTIHSLAQKILRENPFQAGIDPGFVIEEESSDILLSDELWRLWAQKAFRGGTEFDEDLVMLLGYMSAESLKGIALTLAARPDRLPGYFPHRVDPEQEKNRIKKKLHDLGQSLSRVTPSVSGPDPLYERFRTVTEILAHDDLAEIAGLVQTAPLKKQGGSKTRWADQSVFQAVKELIDGPDGAIDTLKGVGTFLRRLEEDAVTHTAIRVLSDFVAFSRAEKRRRGLLSFFDLIWETRSLLVREPKVREQYQHEFDYILVDEFQDIDPILGDIILLLAEDGPAAKRPEDVRLKPGKLFIVGDPKQSIYRFREAEVGVFFSVMRKIEESGGRSDKLDTNYRSQHHLIDFQNAFFDRYIRHEDDRFVIEYVPLKPHLPDIAAADRKPVVRIVDSDPGSTLSAEEIRRAEADFIAAQINALVEKKVEGRIIRDSVTGTVRDIEYRDIAILFRSLSGVSSLYEESLKKIGIPYFIVGGRGYFQRQEVYDVTNIIRAIVDPDDRRALVGALRSPAFGIDDLTLYTAARHRTLSYLTSDPEGPMGDALGAMRTLHGSAFRLTLSGLLSEIYRTIPIVEVNAFGPGGVQRVGNLMKIRETVLALESKGPFTLSAFLKLLTMLSLEREDEGEAAVTEEGRDAVRIMTIHAAKGLEFPIVMVPDLGRKKRPWDREGIFINRSDTAVSGARLGPVADFGYRGAIREHEELRAAAEERRLLYVAATRARDRLILIGSPKEITSHQRALMEFAESIEGATPTVAAREKIDRDLTEKFFFEKRGARIADLFSGPADATPLEEARKREEERRADCELAMGRRFFSFVTEGKQEEPYEPPRAPVVGPDDTGRLVGTLVHEVLGLSDLTGDGPTDSLIATAVEGMGLAPDVRDRVIEEARGLITRFLSSDIRRLIASSQIIGREIPILSSREGVTVTGRIDVAFRTHDGIVVLDYKTDAVTKEGAPGAAERYRAQIVAYVDALTMSAKLDTIVKGAVYFLRPDVVVYF